MDQVFVCTQCGDESDAPGSCQICGLALVPTQDKDQEEGSDTFSGYSDDDDEDGDEEGEEESDGEDEEGEDDMDDLDDDDDDDDGEE